MSGRLAIIVKMVQDADETMGKCFCFLEVCTEFETTRESVLYLSLNCVHDLRKPHAVFV